MRGGRLQPGGHVGSFELPAQELRVALGKVITRPGDEFADHPQRVVTLAARQRIFDGLPVLELFVRQRLEPIGHLGNATLPAAGGQSVGNQAPSRGRPPCKRKVPVQRPP